MPKSNKPEAAAGPNLKGRRRMPSRNRGQMTVDCILQATEQIIREQGNTDTTTNKIADRAGVSISSLYQYFSNKDAIFLALYFRASGEVSKVLRRKTIEFVDKPIDEALSLLVDIALDVFEEHQYSLIHLSEQVPNLRAEIGHNALGKLIYEGSRMYMERHFSDADFEDAEVIYYFLQSTVFSAIRNYLLAQPENISRERFKKELSRMLVNYFRDFEPRT